jgi:hypothetical protein
MSTFTVTIRYLNSHLSKCWTCVLGHYPCQNLEFLCCKIWVNMSWLAWIKLTLTLHMGLIDSQWTFCSTSCISYCEDWNMYTQPMFCIVILSPAICFSIQIVTLKLETLGWQGQHLKQISWLSMWSLVGTEHRSCSLIAQSTLLQLTFGLLVAYLVRLWPENLYFQGKIMFISWGLLQRYAFWASCVVNFCCIFLYTFYALYDIGSVVQSYYMEGQSGLVPPSAPATSSLLYISFQEILLWV